MPLFTPDSTTILSDGNALRGCCCPSPPPPGCLGARVTFYYRFANPPGSNLHGLSGNHNVYAYTDASHYISNTSVIWSESGGTWRSCSSATTVTFLSGTCPNTGCPNGQANILLDLAAAQSITLALADLRTFQESWSSDLVAEIRVWSIQANTQLSVAGWTIASAGTYELGRWTKDQSNTVDNRQSPWTLQVSAR